MIVGTGAGAFAYESGATLRTSIGVDVAGTAAGLVGTHESTYNHGQYNTAYSHSQLASGNPHSVTPTELSLLIGTNTQAWDAGLDSLAGLTYASDSFIKVTAENTYVIRTIAETKSDLSLNLVENTALSTWVGTTNITTLGTIATGVWEATDIAIAHGGTGQSTAQTAIDALTAVSGATNEHVLTKDTATGNAIFKAAAPQIVSRGDPVPYDFTMKKETGSATSTSANHLVDTAATFETNNIAIGDWVYNTTDLTWAAVTAINSEIDLTLGTDIMVNGETYEVGTFKMNNVYHELDLSSIVPAGATYIHVRCVFYDDIVGTNFLLQSNDYSNGRNIFSYNNFAVNTWYSISDFIQCDSNRKIKYSASSPWTYMNLVVRGWILG